MNVDLQDRLVLVGGPQGALREAIEAALRENGAQLSAAQTSPLPGEPFGLVNISAGAGIFSDDTKESAEFATFSRRIRALTPGLKRVVTVMSGAALVPVKGFAAFSAGQAGLERMTRALAMEFGPDLAVNGVAAGALAGPEGNVANGAERFVTHTALRRPGRLEEVCAAVLFLLDPENTYMTGHTLAVDGGWAVGYARNF